MPIFNRAKNILLSPKTEWAVINGETETPQSLLFKYVIPMSLIPAAALFIGFGIIGYGGFLVRGLMMALNSFISSIISYYICTYVVDAMAPNFGSEKNVGKSAQLVAYSFTASWVGGIFFLIPSLSLLAMLAGLYGIYLFYEGIPVMKKTSEQNRLGYLLVSALVIIVVYIVLEMVLRRLLYPVFGYPIGLDLY